MSELRRCREYLTEQGYIKEKQGKKHDTWGKGIVKLSLPHSKVTSPRFFDYVKQTMRHAELKAGVRTTLKG